MAEVKFRQMFDRNGNPFPQHYVIIDDQHVGYVETINWGLALIKRLPEDQVELIKKGIEGQLNGSSGSVAQPPESVSKEEDEDEYEEFA